VNIDDCRGVDCHNGQCVDGLASFTCHCADGFIGRLCEVEVDECASSPCLSGGTCVDLVASYQCQCAPGTSGQWHHLQVHTFSHRSLHTFLPFHILFLLIFY
jgi:hypothetical protein